MAAKRHKAEEIVTKLRQVDVLNAQGKSMVEANCAAAPSLSPIMYSAPMFNAAHLRDPHLRIVLPRDYALILSRGALIPSTSGQKALAGAFVDYLLSERGQKKARDASFYFSANGPLPQGVDGPASLIDAGIGRPIRISPALLAARDQAQRKRFTKEWVTVMEGKQP